MPHNAAMAVEVDVSAKARILYDSNPVDLTSVNEIAFFRSSVGKNSLTMDPLINGRLPAGQRATVYGIAFAFGAQLDLGDDLGALDESFFEFIVQDGEGVDEKFNALLRDLPAGGGIDGVYASGDFTAAINQQNLNNGTPEPDAIFALDVPQVIGPEVQFECKITIPVAIGGLTASNWFVYLHSTYEEFLQQA